jgi:hypothetical protein
VRSAKTAVEIFCSGVSLQARNYKTLLMVLLKKKE